MIRTAPAPLNFILGSFLFLAAVVAAVAPMPLLFRSLGTLLFAYLAFGVAGMPAAYFTALLAPPLGLISGDATWLVMLPVVLSSNLLGMLGLEYAWRVPALLLSPVLVGVPLLVAWQAAQRPLFEVELPWDGGQATWLIAHVLVAFAGVLIALYLHRRRTRQA